jgi:hypothetical protein
MSKYDQPQQMAYSRTLQPKQPQAQSYGRQPQRQQAQQPRQQVQPQSGTYSPRQQSSMGYGYQPQPQPRQRQQPQPQLPAQGSDEYNNYDPRARAEIDAQRRYQGQSGGMNGYRSTYDQIKPQPQNGGYNPREMQSRAAQQAQVPSSRLQQGTYVGEGVYADGSPMPPDSGMANFQDDGRRFAAAAFPGQAPTPSSGFNGQSLVQSNGGPDGGVYSGFDQGAPDIPLPLEQPEEGMRRMTERGNAGGGDAWWQRLIQRGR